MSEGIDRLRKVINERDLADLRAVHRYVSDRLQSMYYDLDVPQPSIKDVSYHGEAGYKIELELDPSFTDRRDFDPSMLEMQILRVVEKEDPNVSDIRSEVRGNILILYVS